MEIIRGLWNACRSEAMGNAPGSLRSVRCHNNKKGAKSRTFLIVKIALS